MVRGSGRGRAVAVGAACASGGAVVSDGLLGPARAGVPVGVDGEDGCSFCFVEEGSGINRTNVMGPGRRFRM